ncbi:MAG: hypothetical protein Q7S17_10000 [Xanthobacteraceae bacterium]|nr:hypothetical protein [Xanthobacteraceae bacterium]
MTTRAMTVGGAATSSELYPIPDEPEVRRMIFRLARRERDPSSGKMVIEAPLTSIERQQIDRRLHTLAAPLAPAKAGQIRDAVLQMLAGFNTAKTGNDDEAKAITTQYVKAMAGLPAFAVMRACLRFARGEVSADELGEQRIIKGIHPPTSYLRIIAEKIARQYWDEALIGSMLLHAQIAPPPISEGEKERRAAKAQAAKDEIHRASAAIALKDAASDAAKRDSATARRLDRDRQDKIAEYAAAGLDPVYADEEHTLICSLPMMIHMGWKIGEIDGRKVLTRGGA